jgi:hypothetical protein
VATLLTNALPIAAGMSVFHEGTPAGLLGVLRVLSFATVVASAAAFAAARGAEEATEPPLARRRDPAAAGSTVG